MAAAARGERLAIPPRTRPEEPVPRLSNVPVDRVHQEHAVIAGLEQDGRMAHVRDAVHHDLGYPAIRQPAAHPVPGIRAEPEDPARRLVAEDVPEAAPP